MSSGNKMVIKDNSQLRISDINIYNSSNYVYLTSVFDNRNIYKIYKNTNTIYIYKNNTLIKSYNTGYPIVVWGTFFDVSYFNATLVDDVIYLRYMRNESSVYYWCEYRLYLSTNVENDTKLRLIPSFGSLSTTTYGSFHCLETKTFSYRCSGTSFAFLRSDDVNLSTGWTLQSPYQVISNKASVVRNHPTIAMSNLNTLNTGSLCFHYSTDLVNFINLPLTTIPSGIGDLTNTFIDISSDGIDTFYITYVYNTVKIYEVSMKTGTPISTPIYDSNVVLPIGSSCRYTFYNNNKIYGLCDSSIFVLDLLTNDFYISPSEYDFSLKSIEECDNLDENVLLYNHIQTISPKNFNYTNHIVTEHNDWIDLTLENTSSYFTGNVSMTFTPTPSQINVFRYKIEHNNMHIQFNCNILAIGGTASNALYIKIPENRMSTKIVTVPGIMYNGGFINVVVSNSLSTTYLDKIIITNIGGTNFTLGNGSLGFDIVIPVTSTPSIT